MIRIALVVGQLSLGGAEKQLYQLAVGLALRGYKPLVISLNVGGEREAELRAAGVETVSLPRAMSFDVRRVLRIARVLRDFSPEILHGIDYAGSAYGKLAGALAGVPILVGGVRSEWTPPKKVIYLERMLRRRTAATISNSFAGRRAWAALSHYPLEDIAVVPNGFDFAGMRSAPIGLRPLREHLGLAGGEPLVGCVGAIYDLKNPLMLVEVAARLAARRVRAHFVWVGDGPMRGEVERAVAARGLGDVFHLLGRRGDAPWLARDFQIGVLTSVVEGLPNAVMEYMYWGLPVVTTNAGDCGRLVEHGRTGFVVERNDPAAMAGRLERFILDPDTAGAMGALGRERLERDFNVETMLDRTVAVYEALRLEKTLGRRGRERQFLPEPEGEGPGYGFIENAGRLPRVDSPR